MEFLTNVWRNVRSRFRRPSGKTKDSSEILPEQPETLEKPAPAIPKKKKWNKKPAITIAAGVLLLASGVVLCCWVFSRSSTAERSESKREGIPTLSNLDKNLFQAVRDGDMDLVYRYLREGANINAVNNVGNTPIKVAIALNRVDIARELCDEGGASSFTSFTQGRSSPLIYAIVQNKPEIIRELLKSITDAKKIVNEIDRNGLTPLMYAVDRNYVAVARELLRAGADVDKPNKEGYTPLMTAVTVGKADMVAVLLDAGADTKAISPEGETALSIARRRNKQVIISLLSEAQQSRLL